MIVKREDLMAAAAAGVVPYTQIDPLLIFLHRRDMNRQREAMLQDKQPAQARGGQTVWYLLALLAVVVAVALAVMYGRLAVGVLSGERLLWFVGAYAVFTLAAVAWFERRKIGASVRIFCTAVIAMLPLAMFTSQQLGW
jgi:hypothetical protein